MVRQPKQKTCGFGGIVSKKDLRGPNKQTSIPILRLLGFFAVYRWNPTLESPLTIKTINEFLFDRKEADKIVFNRRSCLVCQFKILKIGKGRLGILQVDFGKVSAFAFGGS